MDQFHNHNHALNVEKILLNFYNILEVNVRFLGWKGNQKQRSGFKYIKMHKKGQKVAVKAACAITVTCLYEFCNDSIIWEKRDR